MPYGETTPTSPNRPTFNQNIDGILGEERWRSRTVTYSFTDNFRNDYEDELNYQNSLAHVLSFREFSAVQKRQMRQATKQFEAVSKIKLKELTGNQDRNATIRIAESSHPRTAYAYTPGDFFESGDIWFNRSDFGNPVLGTYAHNTFMHEMGHSLGLEHGHEQNGVNSSALTRDRDSSEFSIMTYRDYPNESITNPTSNTEMGSYAQSLMMLDIAALQEMYGANYQTQSGNTTYSFSTETGEMFINGAGQGRPLRNKIYRTIWDGNGNDTYNLSNYNRSISVNLNPGEWSNFDRLGNNQRAKLTDDNRQIFARGHVFNALLHKGDRRSLIENAIGGSGNDRLSGNVGDNRLVGNRGNDRLWGFRGKDRLLGNAGQDTLVGGAGNDVLLGGDHSDQLFGSDKQSRGRREIDQLRGGKGSDIFNLGEDGTTFYRDSGANGDRSYAHVLDLDVFGGDADRINVIGAKSQYGIRAKTIDGDRGFGVYLNNGNDLLAFVEGDRLNADRVRSRLF